MKAVRAVTNEYTQESEGIQSTGEMPAIASSDAVAVYDPRDGRVMHMHHVITFQGGHRFDESHQERDALEYARRLGCRVEGLATLRVRDFRPRHNRCFVDLKRKVLVELPLPAGGLDA